MKKCVRATVKAVHDLQFVHVDSRSMSLAWQKCIIGQVLVERIRRRAH